MIRSPENLLPAMAEHILQWAEIQSSPIIPEIIAAVRCHDEREFLRWCQSSKTCSDLRSIDKRCASLLYHSLKLTMYSADHLTSLQTAALSGVYPYWRLWVNTRFCAGHKSLNNFVARFDSRIWEFIYPPNGWVCGCAVTVIDENDPLVAGSRNLAVTDELKHRCTNWLDRKPIRQWLLTR